MRDSARGSLCLRWWRPDGGPQPAPLLNFLGKSTVSLEHQYLGSPVVPLFPFFVHEGCPYSNMATGLPRYVCLCLFERPGREVAWDS